MVDCSRQLHPRERDAGGLPGFNPCCGGLQSSTLVARLGAQKAKLFQSLLWWIAVVNEIKLSKRVLVSRVSILVVVDCSRQQAVDHGQQRIGHVSILVVVDCSRQRRTSPTWPIPRPGFNPCCGGLQSSTGPYYAKIVREKAFQSLLWWIAVVNSRLDLDRQSSKAGFNPCCGGLQSSTSGWESRGSACQEVSILVVVDCSRQRRCERRRSRNSDSFNPCCGGLQSSTTAGERYWS